MRSASVKILHTSDWHLGKSLGGFSRHQEQQAVLEEICDIADAEKVHAVVIAGDLFDAFNPPAESVDLFYKTLKRLSAGGKRAVIAIAGNHDSPDRIEAPDPLARECGIIFAGYPNTLVHPFSLDTGLEVTKSEPGFLEIKLPGMFIPLRVVITPYANELRIKKQLGLENTEEQLRDALEQTWQEQGNNHLDSNGVNILVSHLLFMNDGDELPEEPEDEKPILHLGGAQAIFTSNLPAPLQYVALGHLHRMQAVDRGQSKVFYSGSPLAYSFSEASQDKYVLVANLQPGENAEISQIKLKKGRRLVRKRFDDVDKAIQWLVDHPTELVEVTLATDNYLTGQERRRLSQAHKGIISIIPEVKNAAVPGQEHTRTINPTDNIETLFSAYFRDRFAGQEPGEGILNLFREVLSTDKEDDTSKT